MRCDAIDNMKTPTTQHSNPAGIYMFKVNNGNTEAMCQICSNLII